MDSATRQSYHNITRFHGFPCDDPTRLRDPNSHGGQIETSPTMSDYHIGYYSCLSSDHSNRSSRGSFD